MKCFECKGNMKQSTRTHVVDFKSCIVIVRNVPCLECGLCGEAYYTDEVQKRLDEIVMVMKDFMTEIAVVEYTENKVA